MDSLDARPISGTDKDWARPFFSPDGQWLGYHSPSEGKLKKVAVSGGVPQALCDVGAMFGTATWDSEDTILYPDITAGIMKVSANGGTPEVLIKGNIKNIEKEFENYIYQQKEKKSEYLRLYEQIQF